MLTCMLTHMLGLVNGDDRHAGTLRADSHADLHADSHARFRKR